MRDCLRVVVAVLVLVTVFRGFFLVLASVGFFLASDAFFSSISALTTLSSAIFSGSSNTDNSTSAIELDERVYAILGKYLKKQDQSLI